jgi:hypothetical protein
MGYVNANSGSTSGEQTGVCDVHALLEHDTRPRPVQWCALCEAWLCDQCRGDLKRRARAMLKRKFGR